MRYWFICGLVACGRGAPLVPNTDCAENLTIDDCFRGVPFADCGGTGDPAIGCSSDECLWFTGGCMPRSYDASFCPPTEDCEYREGSSTCYYFLLGWGLEPWDRARAMSLDVGIDAAVPDETTDFTCSGVPDEEYAIGDICGDEVVVTATFGGLLAIQLVAEQLWFGWYVVLEADLEAMTARLCSVTVTDGVGVCVDPEQVGSCASTGTILLSRVPATEADLSGLSGTVDVTFDDGLHITGHFAVP